MRQFDVVIRRGASLSLLQSRPGERGAEFGRRVGAVLGADPEATAAVDVTGLGAGLLDWLREQGCRADALPREGIAGRIPARKAAG